MCIADQLQATSISLGEVLQKRAEDHFSFITKRSIYYIEYKKTQIFSLGVDWSKDVCLMEVFAMLHKCTYCALTLHDSKMSAWLS